MDIKDQVIFKMVEFDKGDAMRIQHFMKVYEFSHLIAVSENVDKDTRELLEVAAILHDIGIHPSEAKYGDASGKHQEELGPGYARKLLEEMHYFSDAFIDRVCYLIGHHHTYTNIEGIDCQILIEADFLVNSFEENYTAESIEAFRNNIFRTETGKSLLDRMFGYKF